MIHLCFWTKFKFMKHIPILQKSTINFLDIDLSLYYFSNYSLPLATTIFSLDWSRKKRVLFRTIITGSKTQPIRRISMLRIHVLWESGVTIDRAQSVDHFVPSFSLDLSMAEFNKIEMNSHYKCLTNVNNLENNRGFSKNNCNCYKQ